MPTYVSQLEYVYIDYFLISQAAPVMEDLWTTNTGNPLISADHERSGSAAATIAKLNTFDYQGKMTYVKILIER